MATEPIVIRFRYTEQEAITATREMTSAVFRFIRFMPWCGALFLLLGIIYPVIKGYDILEYLTPIVVGVVLLLTPLQIRFQAKRRFKKSTLAEKMITWQITPDTLKNETDFSQASFSWKALVKVRETSSGFLFFAQSNFAHWIPLHALPTATDAERLRDCIRQSGVRYER